MWNYTHNFWEVDCSSGAGLDHHDVVKPRCRCFLSMLLQCAVCVWFGYLWSRRVVNHWWCTLKRDQLLAKINKRAIRDDQDENYLHTRLQPTMIIAFQGFFRWKKVLSKHLWLRLPADSNWCWHGLEQPRPQAIPSWWRGGRWWIDNDKEIESGFLSIS